MVHVTLYDRWFGNVAVRQNATSDSSVRQEPAFIWLLYAGQLEIAQHRAWRLAPFKPGKPQT